MLSRATMLTMAICMGLICSSASALPSLQLYTPGGNYDTVTETWVTTENPFALQVIGAQSPAWVNTITSLSLIVVVPEGGYDAANSVTIQSTDWLSPLVLGNGGLVPQAVADSGFPIPLHGIGPEYFWSVDLPDLMVGSAGVPIWNVKPGSNGSDVGDVQDYTITSSFSALHFDLTGTAVSADGKTKDVFAPFSHDAEFHGNTWEPDGPGDGPHGSVPEPTTIALLGTCLAGMAMKTRRKLRNRRSA